MYTSGGPLDLIVSMHELGEIWVAIPSVALNAFLDGIFLGDEVFLHDRIYGRFGTSLI